MDTQKQEIEDTPQSNSGTLSHSHSSHSIPVIESDSNETDQVLVEATDSRRSIYRKLLFLTGLIASFLLMSLIISCVIQTQSFHRLVGILRKHQFAGSIIYVCTFTILIVICFPSTMLELLAGYIFDVKLGLPLAMLGKMCGCVASFCIGRYFCQKRVRRYMENGHPFFLSLEALLQQRECLIVFLTRIAFFPIAIKNYGLSVLNVSWIIFFVAALLTGIPYSILWVYSGHMAQHLTSLFAPLANKSEHHSSEWKWHFALGLVGFTSSIVLLALVGVSTRRYIVKLSQQLQDEAKNECCDGKMETL
ncbi:unnamed protein product [Albugo candida]|nr:unnamed protein product [Albugo candida]|eukprot:CCI44416.1 unnamed protein product [Albugo candida]